MKTKGLIVFWSISVIGTTGLRMPVIYAFQMTFGYSEPSYHTFSIFDKSLTMYIDHERKNKIAGCFYLQKGSFWGIGFNTDDKFNYSEVNLRLDYTIGPLIGTEDEKWYVRLGVGPSAIASYDFVNYEGSNYDEQLMILGIGGNGYVAFSLLFLIGDFTYRYYFNGFTHYLYETIPPYRWEFQERRYRLYLKLGGKNAFIMGGSLTDYRWRPKIKGAKWDVWTDKVPEFFIGFEL